MDTDDRTAHWRQPGTMAAGMPLLAGCPAPPDDTPLVLLRLNKRTSNALSAAGATTVGDLARLATEVLLGFPGTTVRDIALLRDSLAGTLDALLRWPGAKDPARAGTARHLRLMFLVRGRWSAVRCPNLTSARRRWDTSRAVLGLVAMPDETPPPLNAAAMACGGLLVTAGAAASEARGAEWRPPVPDSGWLAVEADGLRRASPYLAAPPDIAPTTRSPHLSETLPPSAAGITGPALRALRRAGISRIGAVRGMSLSKLAATPGIGRGRASWIKASVRPRETVPPVDHHTAEPDVAPSKTPPASEPRAPVTVPRAQVADVAPPTDPLLDLIEANLGLLTAEQAFAVSLRFGLAGPVRDIPAIAAETGRESPAVDALIKAGLAAVDGATGAMTRLAAHGARLRTLAPLPVADVLSESWTMGMPTEVVAEMLSGLAGLDLVGTGDDARFEVAQG